MKLHYLWADVLRLKFLVMPRASLLSNWNLKHSLFRAAWSWRAFQTAQCFKTLGDGTLPTISRLEEPRSIVKICSWEVVLLAKQLGLWGCIPGFANAGGTRVGVRRHTCVQIVQDPASSLCISAYSDKLFLSHGFSHLFNGWDNFLHIAVILRTQVAAMLLFMCSTGGTEQGRLGDSHMPKLLLHLLPHLGFSPSFVSLPCGSHTLRKLLGPASSRHQCAISGICARAVNNIWHFICISRLQS